MRERTLNELRLNQSTYIFNYCDMGSHEQETRCMTCLRQKLNYVKTRKSDEEISLTNTMLRRY